MHETRDSLEAAEIIRLADLHPVVAQDVVGHAEEIGRLILEFMSRPGS
jgi:hypothetical protein